MAPNMTIVQEKKRGLFPEIEPFNRGRLRVSSIHEIYFEESGNPSGFPVVVLHGGPGGGSSPTLRRFHDPAYYRIINFDQRGCGRSTPHAALEQNTTWDLVADMEMLRQHLGIARWQVFGGSWGSTLALAYALAHPQPVRELILRGIFTVRQSEIEWFYQHGASMLFPDHWERYIAPIPEDERHDLVAAHYRRLTGEDREQRLASARAWSQWEGATLSLLPDPAREAAFGEDQLRHRLCLDRVPLLREPGLLPAKMAGFSPMPTSCAPYRASSSRGAMTW